MGTKWRRSLLLSVTLLTFLTLEFGVPRVVAASSFALNFTADGQGAIVPDSNSLDITGPLTLEAWVMPGKRHPRRELTRRSSPSNPLGPATCWPPILKVWNIGSKRR